MGTPRESHPLLWDIFKRSYKEIWDTTDSIDFNLSTLGHFGMLANGAEIILKELPFKITKSWVR